jgi:hypothetical protein
MLTTPLSEKFTVNESMEQTKAIHRSPVRKKYLD